MLKKMWATWNVSIKAAAHQPIFCRSTKNLLHLSNSVRWIQTSATRSGLVGRYLTGLDLKTSCRALLASVRWSKTICRGSRVLQSMRNSHESHVNKRLISNMADIDSAQSLNAVSRNKKNRLVCGKLMSRQTLTRFDPDKKSAALRHKIG